MNEFTMFLRENYEWLLIVVVLIVITTIGFLADKKKTNTKKEIKQEEVTPSVPSFVHEGEHAISAHPDVNIQNQEPKQDIQISDIPEDKDSDLNQPLNLSKPVNNMNPMSPNLSMAGINSSIEPMTSDNINNQNPFTSNVLGGLDSMPAPDLGFNLNQPLNQSNPGNFMNSTPQNLNMMGMNNNINPMQNNDMNNPNMVPNNTLNGINSIPNPNLGTNLNQPLNQSNPGNFMNSTPQNLNMMGMNNNINNTPQNPNNNPNMLQGVNNMANNQMIQNMNEEPQMKEQTVAPTPVVHKPIEVQPIKGMTGGAINFVNGPQNPNNNN